MKQIFLAVMTFVVAIAAVSCGSNKVESVREAQELSGAGATFPQPFYNVVFEKFAQQHGDVVAYGGIGSGGGVRNLRDKIVALGIAEEIPAGGAMQAPVNNAVKDEAVSALTMLGFAPAPSQKVVVQILQEQPDAPVEVVVKLALKQIK